VVKRNLGLEAVLRDSLAILSPFDQDQPTPRRFKQRSAASRTMLLLGL